MGGIEEARDQYHQQAAVLREYAGELQQVRGLGPTDVFFCPDTERETFLSSEPTGYHTIIEALAWFVDNATALSYETHARFTQLSEQTAPTNSSLPVDLDPHRDQLHQQYEKIAGIANDLKECLGQAAVMAGYLQNHGGTTASIVSKKLEADLIQRAEIAEQNAGRL